MDLKKLIRHLNDAAVNQLCCLGCDYEDNCSIHGCQVMKTAVGVIQVLEQGLRHERSMSGKTHKAEQQAIFRLGQKDMQASVMDMLLDTAAKMPANGMVGPTLRIAADMVKNMEVP